MNINDTTRLQRLAVSDAGFAFDPQTGESFTINQTGQEILRKLAEGHSLDEIVDDISQLYQVDQRSVMSDVQDYTQQLRSLDLVEVQS